MVCPVPARSSAVSANERLAPRMPSSISGSMLVWRNIAITAKVPAQRCTRYIESSPPKKRSRNRTRTASTKLQAIKMIDAAPMNKPKATLPSSPVAPANANHAPATDDSKAAGPTRCIPSRGPRSAGGRNCQSERVPNTIAAMLRSPAVLAMATAYALLAEAWRQAVADI